MADEFAGDGESGADGGVVDVVEDDRVPHPADAFTTAEPGVAATQLDSPGSPPPVLGTACVAPARRLRVGGPHGLQVAMPASKAILRSRPEPNASHQLQI